MGVKMDTCLPESRNDPSGYPSLVCADLDLVDDWYLWFDADDLDLLHG